MRTYLLVLPFLLILVAQAEDTLQAGPRLKAEKFPAELVTFLNKVEKVETHRLQDKGATIIRTAQGKSFGKERALEIAATLLKDESYNFDEKKLCEPDFGFQFVLWAGNQSLEINVCFHCSQMSLRMSDSKDALMFDIRCGQTLAKWAKEALPDDPEIQKLYK